MKDTRCVLPWLHLASHPNGGQSLCCRSNHQDAVSWAMQPGTTSLQTFDNTSLKTMANSETFVRVRQAMLDGKEPVECEGCWQEESLGVESKRQYENRRWAHVIPKLETTAILKKPNYRYVELRLGNVCNTACVTCNSFSSSKWYSDEEKISKSLDWFTLRPMENFKWHDRGEFYEELAELSQDVEEIYINGGEPTLIKAHFRYLEMLVDNQQAQNVHLVYSLNMTDIPATLVDLWKNFKKVTVNCSIDDLGPRNFYIRWPTAWNRVVENLETLNSIPAVEWHVTQTVSIYNIFTLDELNQWLITNYNKSSAFNFVLYPEYLSLAAIPNSLRDKLKDQYKSSFDRHRRSELFARLEQPYNREQHLRAKQFITALDQSRQLDYKKYVPMLESILNADS